VPTGDDAAVASKIAPSTDPAALAAVPDAT
jgi:hypothetical protein